MAGSPAAAASRMSSSIGATSGATSAERAPNPPRRAPGPGGGGPPAGAAQALVVDGADEAGLPAERLVDELGRHVRLGRDRGEGRAGVAVGEQPSPSDLED